ncbi:hypothetical protein NDU88_008310 [Pleurodeles waltl]|uniref:Uncharacterized protein n=1 Tax=Pleurodeles waltl TaxID=8319 RepID=A0AAV7SVB5_PLEWA|nr:hypothetical protein NDU88_008310 [Pleurodeles waltl]
MAEKPGLVKTRQERVETRLRQRQVYNERMSKKRRARPRSLNIGDVVLMKNRRPGSKFKTRFESGMWAVTRVKGTLVTVTKGDEVVTRNISCFKRYHGAPADHQESGNNSDHEEGECEFGRVGGTAEHWLASGNLQMGEGLAAQKTTTPGSPVPNQDDVPAEAPAEGSNSEATRRSGLGRYNLRSRLTLPERLRDYVCE